MNRAAAWIWRVATSWAVILTLVFCLGLVGANLPNGSQLGWPSKARGTHCLIGWPRYAERDGQYHYMGYGDFQENDWKAEARVRDWGNFGTFAWAPTSITYDTTITIKMRDGAEPTQAQRDGIRAGIVRSITAYGPPEDPVFVKLLASGEGAFVVPLVSGYVHNTAAGLGVCWFVASLVSRFRRGFRKELELRRTKAELCPGCGYSLEGSTTGVCPECGRGKGAR